MKRAYAIAIIVSVLSILLAGSTLLSESPLSEKIFFAGLVIITLMHIGASIIFILGLKGFQKRLRKAYLIICASFLMLVAVLIQGVVLAALGAYESDYVLWGASDIPVVLMMFLAYFGVRTIAQLIEVRSVFLKPWVVFLLALGVGLVAALMPTTRIDYPEIVIDVSAFIFAVEAAICVIVALLAFKTFQNTSVLYKKSFRWLGVYYGIVALVLCANVLAQLYLPFTHWYWQFGVSYMAYNVVSFVAIFAAISFNRVAYAEQQVIASSGNHTKSQQQNPVDVVTFLAQFASNPREIGSALDSVRLITTRPTYRSGMQLSEADQTNIAKTYLDIENLLVTKESVRKFTKEQLRQMIEVRFEASVNASAFWKRIAENA